jgi:predicted CXXCH cytochrome family protein
MRTCLLAVVVLCACDGATGPAGPSGPPGEPGGKGDPGISTGTLAGVVRDERTSSPITLASVVTVPGSSAISSADNGAFSLAGVAIGVYTLQVSATGYEPRVIVNVSVAAGKTTSVDVMLARPAVTTASVSGVVRRRTVPDDPRAPVASATVALVDSFTLAASALDAPLEPLAAASPYTASTAPDGSYAISGVAPGQYFVHVTPAASDEGNLLPGGDASRQSFALAAGAEHTADVTLSQRPSPSATYVGSSVCMLCHQGHLAPDATGWKSTLHALVYRVPGSTSAIQDLSRLPNHDQALTYFRDGNARDNTGAGDSIGLRIANATFPKFPTGYDLLLGFDTRYFVQFATANRISSRYYVDFTFGGHGIFKERFVTRVSTDGSYDPTPGGDSSYYILPLQYDEDMPAAVEPFHPYNPGNWAGPPVAGGAAVRPAQSKSFDNNCAGCHFTGTRLSVDAQGNFHAAAAQVPVGALDYDGDSMMDEMDVGCEACHGPGSDHIGAGTGVGRRIISPKFLSAERSSATCGACHSRTEGKGTLAGVHTEYPSKGVDGLTFPTPGISFTELQGFFADIPGTFNDDTSHARQHHQQYTDMRKSVHNKNPFHMLACDDCHDSHDRSKGPSLIARADNNDLCLGCHAYYTFDLGAPPWLPQTGWTREQEANAVSLHMTVKADMTVGYDPLDTTNRGPVGRCTSCHMPKTASSRSRFIHDSVDAAGQPSGRRIAGDISSHVFDIITPATSQSVFLNNATNNQLPNSCGSCHNSVAGIAPNYTW